jgi:hypothetical protein
MGVEVCCSYLHRAIGQPIVTDADLANRKAISSFFLLILNDLHKLARP